MILILQAGTTGTRRGTREEAAAATGRAATVEDTRHLLASQVHLLGNFITKAKIFTF